MIGVLIAIGANAVIPLALNLQKYAHVQNTDQVHMSIACGSVV